MSAPTSAGTSQNVLLPHIPELYDAEFLDILLPRADQPMVDSFANAEPPKNPMLEALKADASHTWTDNGSPSFGSTGSDTLDAFQMLKPQASRSDLYPLLAKAWEEDPNLTVRMIWNCRSIHDGKGERETFYRAFGWLYDKHPRTAIANLAELVEPRCVVKKDKKAHGYWKDLLNIVALAAVGELSGGRDVSQFLHNYQPRSKKCACRISTCQSGQPKVHPLAATLLEYEQQQKLKSREEHVSKNAHFHEGLVARLAEPRFRALYIMVARLFAEKLAAEVALLDRIEALPAGKERGKLVFDFTWVGKWAPTPRKSHDRVTNLSTAIALLLHHAHAIGPTLSRSRDDPLSALDAHSLRSFYRRWVLMPLRQVLRCPEPLMSSNRWQEINYARVPSICMKLNSARFVEHDPKGFEAYLTAVEGGKITISGATLKPHEIVAELMRLRRTADWQPVPGKPDVKDLKMAAAQAQMRALEAQWKSLVDSLREAGTLNNCLALCDVSGSMGDVRTAHASRHDVQPILPAMSLSLVISQIAKPPFANQFLTFSARPQFLQIDPSLSLVKSLDQMSMADWGMNTNLNAVFLDLLLPLAKANKVKQDDMIKRFFIFTDMQFDSSHSQWSNIDALEEWRAKILWETNHDTIEKAFKEAGYEMPQIVYWNLSTGRNVSPVQHDRKGVAIMNGFSPALLKAFLEEDMKVVEDDWVSVDNSEGTDPTIVEEDQEFNPVNMMKKALLKASFDGLVVVD